MKLVYFGDQIIENAILIISSAGSLITFLFCYAKISIIINTTGRRHKTYLTQSHLVKMVVALIIVLTNALGILLNILMRENVYLMILIAYTVQFLIWTVCLITIRAEFLYLGKTTIYQRIFYMTDLLITATALVVEICGLSQLELPGIVTAVFQFVLFIYSQILPNDLPESTEQTTALIQPKQQVTRKKTLRRFNNNQRYKPFYYNSTYDSNQYINSPQFVSLPEGEKQSYSAKIEEELKNNQIQEIYVTGWEIVEKYSSDNLQNPCLTFIIELVRKNEIYFTKRTFAEFIELFKSLQKHSKYIFPKLKPCKLEGNESPKDIQEIFSKILQVINSEQIGKHINFQQFLMPKDKLEEFVMNQVATFSSNNFNDSPQSFQRSSDFQQKIESLRRKCSVSPQKEVEEPVAHTMSFGTSNLQKQINIEILFNKTDNRPKYDLVQVIDWDYGEPDENSMIIHGKSNVKTEAEDEVYFFIKFAKYKKNIPYYYVKRSIKDLNELRNYYELIYENREFPQITPSNLSINKESFRGDNNGYEALKIQINKFFDYIIENQLTSLNLKKFLEENSAILEENDLFSTSNLENESSQFLKNGVLN